MTFTRTVLLVALVAIVAETASVSGGEVMATADRVLGARWWPTKGTSARSDYVGAEMCAQCHAAQSTTQPMTSMARTAVRAADSPVFRSRRRLTLKNGAHAYEIAPTGEDTIYTVTDGTRTLSAPLAWAFGVGKVGQSFLFEKDNVFHEARVSYYASIDTLDFTPGRALVTPRDVSEATARPIGQTEARRCFACHTTGATTRGAFDGRSAVAGLSCEACHGPGRQHVEAVKERRMS